MSSANLTKEKMAFIHTLCFKIKIMLYFILTISSIIHESQAQNHFLTTLESLCDATFYPKVCFNSLSHLLDSKKKYDPMLIYNVSLKISTNQVFRASNIFSQKGEMTRLVVQRKEKILLSALQTCRDFISLAVYNLNMSLPTDDGVATAQTRTNFRTWLSAARSDLQTCLDEFEHAPEAMRKTVATYLEKSTQLVGTSLGIITKIDEYMNLHEKPLALHQQDGSDKLTSHMEPSWVSLYDRDTLQNVKPDVVVAADGSGNYTTINEAIAVVPPRSNKRFVIYVKKGVYLENVLVETTKQNILMYGDGMDKTVVSSNRSNATGSSTVQSATFAVRGSGFIAMYMGFKNTAGPANGQAVALFSASDKSVFYRCLLDGYQDTFYAHSNRQFYRECSIYGTVDFIFGDAALVIQNSNIYAKRGRSKGNVITAQGKDIPQSVSGTSIQNCSFLPAENLDGITTFLGRPWKNYSTAIIMESNLGSLIDPKGWRAWGPNIPVPDTILYVEYNNTGPAAVTTNRVQWKGLKLQNTQDYARNYTVGMFLEGSSWLPSTCVPFQADL